MIRTKDSRGKRAALWVISLLIIVPGAIGFGEKLVQFIRTMGTDHGASFTLVPISNYFLVAAGMACMLVWAVAHGMFHDIEAPKYDLLEREEELDRRDGFHGNE